MHVTLCNAAPGSVFPLPGRQCGGGASGIGAGKVGNGDPAVARRPKASYWLHVTVFALK